MEVAGGHGAIDVLDDRLKKTAKKIYPKN